MNRQRIDRRVTATRALGLVCGASLVIAAVGGCGPREKAAIQQPAVSDTTAYRSIGGIADTTARLAAYETFLKDYPQSVYRPNAVGQTFNILMKRDPARAAEMVRSRLKTEQDANTRGRLHYSAYLHARDKQPDAVSSALGAMAEDPAVSADALNSVSWDLITRGQHLDQAIRLAEIGVTRASDEETKASVMDTQGWGYYVKGDYGQAVVLLEQAASLVPKEDAGEMRGHLALAYDKAGKQREARELMTEIMGSMEDLEMRAAIERISRDLGEDPAPIFAAIDRTRAANARPAPDFTLSGYDGNPIRFGELNGKVVLLNFWHPT
jgi:tetratricopeptide (TPR) repeat protein